MKKNFILFICCLFISAFLLSCNTTNSRNDLIDTTYDDSTATMSAANENDSIPFSDTIHFDNAKFSKEDSIKSLVYRAKVYEVRVNGADLIKAINTSDYVFFQPVPVAGVADNYDLQLFKVVGGIKTLITSHDVSLHTITPSSPPTRFWIRGSKLYRTVAVNFLNRLRAEGYDLNVNPNWFEIHVIPARAQDGYSEYVGLELSVVNTHNVPNTTALSRTPTHPCPYCP